MHYALKTGIYAILINKNSTIESIKDILKLMQKYNIRLLKFEVDE